jgi:uncharacterized membrane protein YgdD (TMEM256/DUF423 family)
MFHSLALLAVSGHPRLSQKRFGAGALAVGTALFSGSLYAMVLLKSRGKQGAAILGPITPFGGKSLETVVDCCRSYYACWVDCSDSLMDRILGMHS